MITSVAYKPTVFSPAYNPIIWSVLSDKTQSIDFKYVFDIYVDDVKINTIKQRANPSGYGMIDVSSIVQAYLDYSNPGAQVTQGETSIDWTTGQLFANNNLMSRKVYLKVGEEYTLNGTTNIYNGITNQVGSPSYVVYSGNTAVPNTPVFTWSASIGDHEQQWNMQQTTASGIFGGNPFDGNKNYDHNLGLAYPLNFNELNIDAYGFDKMVLSWLNITPNSTTIQNGPIYGFRYILKDSVGGSFTYDRPLITSYGFGQRASCETLITSPVDYKYGLVHVLASPDNVIEALNYNGANPITSIEIQGFKQANPGQCAFGTACTQKVTVNIQDYCLNPLYERVRLSWYNTLGGRDYLNFTMFDEKNINTTQQNYEQEQMNWNLNTPVPLLASTPPINNLGIRGGTKAYNKDVTITRKIMTDWLTQEQVDLLEGLQKSPQVMAYLHDPNNTLANDYPYTVNVMNSTYTTKNVRQTKLVQASFDIKYVTSQKIQNI
jgi:hypothetical protein